jgi:integrase/recombinase XerD
MLTPDGEYFEEIDKEKRLVVGLEESGRVLEVGLNDGNLVGSSDIPVQATSDDQLIDMWMYSKSEKSQESYGFDVAEFRSLVNKGLREVTLFDLQQYARYLEEKGLKPRSRQRKLAAIKSLFSFAANLRYISFDVGKPLKLPKSKDDLANRILDEKTILKIIYTEKDPRNHLLLKISYLLGARVSEMVGLTWEDFHPAEEHIVVTLFGKGEKTRHVLLHKDAWKELQVLKVDASSTSPVFMSTHRKALSRQQVDNIVKKATLNAGVDSKVSAHWFRHAHASHALDNGAPMNLIQQDLGHYSLEVTGRYLHVKPTDGSGLYLRV